MAGFHYEGSAILLSISEFGTIEALENRNSCLQLRNSCTTYQATSASKVEPYGSEYVSARTKLQIQIQNMEPYGKFFVPKQDLSMKYLAFRGQFVHQIPHPKFCKFEL